jgi:hypothetical protein
MTVPNQFDLTISDGTDTYGYVLYEPWTGGEASNAQEKAIHSYSPAFVPRTNVQGNYGDDFQDFFLTVSQKDWELGEGQRHAQDEGTRTMQRYWRGSAVDVSRPGRVTLRPSVENVNLTAVANAMCFFPEANKIAIAQGTNLYTVDDSGTEADLGSHGLNTTVTLRGLASDGTNVFLTGEGGGTTGIRKWDGSAFSTFSSVASSTLLYHNNSLYAIDKDGIFRRYDTAGAATTLHTWQEADSTAFTIGTKNCLCSYGGKILILLRGDGYPTPSLWIYDGAGVSLLHNFPNNFTPHDLTVVNGTAFVSGWLTENDTYRPAIYFYAAGAVGILWQAETYSALGANGPAMTPFGENLAFTDSQTGRIMVYNPSRGGVSSLGAYTANEDLDQMLTAAGDFLLVAHSGGGSFQTPALVQGTTSRDSSDTSVAAPWGQPTTEGNLLLMALVIEDADGTPPTPTTPSGWTLVANEALTSWRLLLYKIENAASRSGVESVTLGDTVSAAISLFEYSGTGQEDVVDTNEGTSTSPDSGTTATTAQNEELWFGLIGYDSASIAEILDSYTNSFTLASNNYAGSNSIPIVRMTALQKVVDATGTANTGGTLPSSKSWIGIIATFRAKGTGEAFLFPGTTKSVGGTLTSSLFDYDSSLTKLFRGIQVDYDEASDGDGGSVDIAYRVGDVMGNYTTVQEEVESGTEYEIGSVGDPITGRSISYRATLNKGTSTDGPVLKRVYVRAAPVVTQRHRGLYHIDCTAPMDGSHPVYDHLGNPLSRTGMMMGHELREFADSGTLLTITDPFHSFTGVIETLEFVQIRTGERNCYVATVGVREV